MSAHVPALPLEVDPLIAEAKQRARRRRLALLAVALAAAGAAGWGVQASGGGGGSLGEIPWLPTRPQLGSANPPLAPACAASQLRATLGLQGATGNLAGGISIVNRSSQPCALVGRPRLSFAGATSRWRETRWHGSSPSPFDPLAPPAGSLRALAPGEHVSVNLWWSNWCGRGSRPNGDSGQPPAAIVLSAPGGGQIRLSNGHMNGGLGAPPCYAYPSTLAATRFTPYVPQGPPSSALPLQARIVSVGRIWSKGKFLTQPSLVAHPGSWLSYTVVLTNRSRRPFHFGRTCPAYTEGFGGIARLQAYVLNCHPVGSIGPGKSVRFAMRMRVPRLALSAPAFGWTLAPHSWNAPGALAVVAVR
jgi:Domain of unknown function (DUF4232)